MSRGSLLPEGITLAGEIRGQGDLAIAGTIEGPILVDGHVVIEPSGVVRGELKARSIVIRGTLIGPAIAEETIRLEPGARVVGDARAERVSVIEGALLRGRITMTGAPPARPRSSAGSMPAPAIAPERVERGDALAAPGTSSLATAAGIAPRPVGGAIGTPRDRAMPEDPEAEPEGRATARFLRPTDLAVPGAPLPEPVRRTAPAPAPATAPPLPIAAHPPGTPPAPRPRVAPRKPPEPVIPGVGRQRARRKDGGAAT